MLQVDATRLFAILFSPFPIFSFLRAHVLCFVALWYKSIRLGFLELFAISRARFHLVTWLLAPHPSGATFVPLLRAPVEQSICEWVRFREPACGA